MTCVLTETQGHVMRGQTLPVLLGSLWGDRTRRQVGGLADEQNVTLRHASLSLASKDPSVPDMGRKTAQGSECLLSISAGNSQVPLGQEEGWAGRRGQQRCHLKDTIT